MTDTTHIHQLGDTVALTSRLLFDHDFPREGTVTAVADDGRVTAEFPQNANFPLTVTGPAEDFVHVRKAPQPVGYVVVRRTTMGALSIPGGTYRSAEAAAEALPLLERRGFEGDVFTVCRLVSEEVAPR